MLRNLMRFVVFASLSALLSLPAPLRADASIGGQTSNPDFEMGMTAARNNDWKSAQQHFISVNRSLPDHSVVLYNLGLASEKLNRMRSAICWYKASLLAQPVLPNRSDVDKEVAALLSQVEKRLADTVESADQLAEQADASDQPEALEAVAQINAGTGRIDAALKYCQQIAPADKSSVERSCWQLYGRYAEQIGDQAALARANKWLAGRTASPRAEAPVARPWEVPADLKNFDEQEAAAMSSGNHEKAKELRRQAFSRLWQYEAMGNADRAGEDSDKGLLQLSFVVLTMSDELNAVRTIEEHYQSGDAAAATFKAVHSQAFAPPTFFASTATSSATGAPALALKHLSPLAPLPKAFKVDVRTRNDRWGFRQHFRGKAVWEHDNIYRISWGLPALPGIGVQWRAYVTGDHVQLVEDRFSLRGAQTTLTGTIVGKRASGSLAGQDLFTSWGGTWEAWW